MTNKAKLNKQPKDVGVDEGDDLEEDNSADTADSNEDELDNERHHRHNEENDDDEPEDDDDQDLDDDDIWTIKPKLLSYYEKQFRTMQPNINGLITGSVAKPFFERSKLPLNELSKIW